MIMKIIGDKVGSCHAQIKKNVFRLKVNRYISPSTSIPLLLLYQMCITLSGRKSLVIWCVKLIRASLLSDFRDVAVKGALYGF